MLTNKSIRNYSYKEFISDLDIYVRVLVTSSATCSGVREVLSR